MEAPLEMEEVFGTELLAMERKYGTLAAVERAPLL